MINHGSRGGWIGVAPRSKVKIGQVSLRLIRLLHGCVDNLRRTRLKCEVISCDKRGKGRLHISETFPTFFWTGIWVVVVVVVFLLEREGWMAPAHGHHQKKGDYLNWDKIITQPALYYQVFFVRAWVSVSLVPRRSLLICCPREVSVTSQLMVESRNDRAENAWGLGWVSVLSWI